jgi:hypothetical protein
MRSLRELSNGVWYGVCTAVNNRETLFWLPKERARLEQVLNEAREIYEFELRGLRYSGLWVMFYIGPDDGFQLPEIMQWVKQTYLVRYNLHDGRTGHIWGDWYASEIVAAGPPEDAEAYVFAPVVCPMSGGKRGALADNQARDAEGRPRTGRRAGKTRLRPDLPRRTAASHG